MTIVDLSRSVPPLPLLRRCTPIPPSTRAARKSKPPQSATMNPTFSQLGYERAHERRGEQKVNREDPVFEGHAFGAICSTT